MDNATLSESLQHHPGKLHGDVVGWFSYKITADGWPIIEFPVTGHTFFNPHPLSEIPLGVIKAMKRLYTRGNIKSVEVTGPTPKYWYRGSPI